MIYLIGLGLSLDMLSIGAIYRLSKKCSKIYIDTYTSNWYPSLDVLVDTLTEYGVEVVKARRQDLEGESIADVIEEARSRDICVAVAGDPLIATTHSTIVIEAFSKNVEVEVLPATSILGAAISLSCLQAYRFGKMITIVRPKNGIIYEYPLYVIEMNRELNLHTLALLEIDIENKYYMTPKEALEILLSIQENLGKNILNYDDTIVVLKALGSPQGEIIVGTVRGILTREFEETVHTLIIPAKTLHPIEEECIRNIRDMVVKPTVSAHSLRYIIKTVST